MKYPIASRLHLTGVARLGQEIEAQSSDQGALRRCRLLRSCEAITIVSSSVIAPDDAQLVSPRSVYATVHERRADGLGPIACACAAGGASEGDLRT